MKIIILLLFFISSVLAEHLHTLNIALFGLDKKVANEKTVNKLFETLIKKIDNLKDLELNTFFYKNEDDLIKDFQLKENKFDILFMIPSTYLKHYTVFNKHAKEILTIQQSENKYVQYYIITNKQSKIKSVKDVRNKSIDLENNDALSHMWFDKISYEINGKIHKRHSIKKNKNFNQYKKILDVYFNKTDLAIVSREIWNTTVNLNPAIKKNLLVIKKSPPIFPSIIGVFHKSSDDEVLKYFNAYIQDKKNDNYMEDILSLVKFKKVEVVKKNDFQEAYEFYEKYLKIKAKYN